MTTSIFLDKNKKPEENNLEEALGKTSLLWKDIVGFVMEKYPLGKIEWHYPGIKYGWSLRIKDNKRAIIYLLPRAQFFKVAFVFGQKATDDILNSEVSLKIKEELLSAKVYAEGRGIRIDIIDNAILNDIKALVEIKLSH